MPNQTGSVSKSSGLFRSQGQELVEKRAIFDNLLIKLGQDIQSPNV